MANRAAIRAAKVTERRALRSGAWPAWEFFPGPVPFAAGGAWVAECDRFYRNGVFAVMVRVVDTAWGLVDHAMIRNVSNTDITWAQKQRIKNEIFGEERLAVEVFPAETQLVDGANMYHLWVLPAGFSLPFGLRRTAAE